MIIQVTQKSYKFWKHLSRPLLAIFRFIIIVTLSFTLTIIWSPKSVGQIPFPLFTTSTDPTPTQAAPWDLNQAYACGRFWCSDVYIHDDSRQLQTTLLTPELTLADLKKLDQNNIEAAQALEQRAKLVQQVFEKIVRSISNSQRTAEVPYISDWQFWLPTSFKELWSPATLKPPHPWTPNIEIGIKNQQTVIFIPDQFDLGIASQSIVTVTEIDAKANGTTVEELAKIWRNSIIISFSNALWGNEFDRQYPGWRWAIAGIIMVIALLLILLIMLIRRYQRKWNNNLKRELDNLTAILTNNPESQTSKQAESEVHQSLNELNGLDNQADNKKKKINLFSFLSNKLVDSLKKVLRKNQWLYSKLHHSRQKLSLQQQTIIKQKINFYQLLMRIELILELLIFLFALVIVCLTFRQTRFFSVYLLKETLLLITLWTTLILIDKLGDFAIDYYLNRWATEAQINRGNSDRYTLRVNTYSITLKQATTFLTIVLGGYLTIWFLGFDPSILAGAGLLAVAIAFLSRNLLEDMISGILILYTDRYAIGDVIDVNNTGGFVESINLFFTSLRNLDGQLIAIPNSKISTVTNNTKNWSRVNFTIRIDWNENVTKAIEIMTRVANEMQSKPEWHDKFLDPVEVLGVDEVSHEGILIHLLIRTQPGEHWGIGREYRLRVKQAFDAAGISLGIPHHKISGTDSLTSNEQLLSNFLLKQDD